VASRRPGPPVRHAPPTHSCAVGRPLPCTAVGAAPRHLAQPAGRPAHLAPLHEASHGGLRLGAHHDEVEALLLGQPAGEHVSSVSFRHLLITVLFAVARFCALSVCGGSTAARTAQHTELRRTSGQRPHGRAGGSPT
jgi:hypothetical protein